MAQDSERSYEGKARRYILQVKEEKVNKMNKKEKKEKKDHAHGVIMVCKDGINRSVTCARILSELLHRIGAHCPHPGHLSSPSWGRKKICKGSCKHCAFTELTEELIAKALKLWHSL